MYKIIGGWVSVSLYLLVVCKVPSSTMHTRQQKGKLYVSTSLASLCSLSYLQRDFNQTLPSPCFKPFLTSSHHIFPQHHVYVWVFFVLFLVFVLIIFYPTKSAQCCQYVYGPRHLLKHGWPLVRELYPWRKVILFTIHQFPVVPHLGLRLHDRLHPMMECVFGLILCTYNCCEFTCPTALFYPEDTVLM